MGGDRASLGQLLSLIFMTATITTRVAIIEDQREIREGLGRLINSTPGYRCTGVYASMEEALEKIPRNLTDVAGSCAPRD